MGHDGGYADQEDNTYRYSAEKGGFVGNRAHRPRFTNVRYSDAGDFAQRPEQQQYHKPAAETSAWSGITNVILIVGGILTVSIGLATLQGDKAV